jgi:hypothetical protein
MISMAKYTYLFLVAVMTVGKMKARDMAGFYYGWLGSTSRA